MKFQQNFPDAIEGVPLLNEIRIGAKISLVPLWCGKGPQAVHQRSTSGPPALVMIFRRLFVVLQHSPETAGVQPYVLSTLALECKPWTGGNSFASGKRVGRQCSLIPCPALPSVIRGAGDFSPFSKSNTGAEVKDARFGRSTAVNFRHVWGHNFFMQWWIFLKHFCDRDVLTSCLNDS